VALELVDQRGSRVPQAQRGLLVSQVQAEAQEVLAGPGAWGRRV
jgi:hypothetical protein